MVSHKITSSYAHSFLTTPEHLEIANRIKAYAILYREAFEALEDSQESQAIAITHHEANRAHKQQSAQPVGNYLCQLERSQRQLSKLGVPYIIVMALGMFHIDSQICYHHVIVDT